MKKFVGFRAKTYIYLRNDGSKDKNAKGKTKCVMKRKLTLEDFENCLEATQLKIK